MRDSLLELLVDPVDRAPLLLDDAVREGDEIVAGTLRSEAGRAYEIVDAIPRVVATEDPGQAHTERSFAHKWERSESYGSEGMRAELHRWLLERYGFASAEEMRAFFAGRGRILDAGCGAGLATSAWMSHDWDRAGGEWVGVDISRAIDVARDRLGAFPGTHFVQADVLCLPFRDATFDVVFAEGVLHHTPSTERAFAALVPLLAPAGELMIYVYRRKAPIREFTDDHVRGVLASLTPEEAWETLRPLTRLAQALAELGVEIEVPDDVSVLGISAGRYDVQRLLYWHVAKLFWNPRLTFEENLHVNFDWYAPRYAHRHTEEQVRRWFADARIEIARFDAQESGFTVRGVKSAGAR